VRNQHGDTEFIEVFSSDDSAAWSDAASEPSGLADPTGDQRRARRGVVVAGLVAVAAAITATAALSDDGNSNTAATTTIPETTLVRPQFDPLPAAHYLIDDPALTPYAADIVSSSGNSEQVVVYSDGTPVGPIAIIETHHRSYEPYGILGASRDVVDGIELVRSPIACPGEAVTRDTRCETVVAEVAADEQWSITIRGTRLNDSDFVQIVRSVGVVNGTLQQDPNVMASLHLGVTFEADSLDTLLFGAVDSTVRYLTADGQIATLRSAVGTPDHRLASLPYLAIDAQASFYDRTYGYLDTGETIVVWEDEGRLLSLVAPIDAAELSRISRHVRQATDREWTAMVYGLRPDFTVGDFATLATGETSNGESWRAGPQIAERAGRTEFLWWWTVPGRENFADSSSSSLAVGNSPNVETVVVPGATFVFVSQPDSGGTVTVRAADGLQYTAELTQPFTKSLVYITVVRIEEQGPVTVTINGMAVTA